MFKKKEKVCLLGTASTLAITPWNDKSYDIWACSPVITYDISKDKRFDLLFELHDENYYGRKEVIDRLNEYKDGSILMKKKVKAIPASAVYPLEELQNYFKEFNGKRYHTNTISMMICLAIYEGYKEIKLLGVHMSSAEEYGSQRQACEYWIGIAEGKGIKVFIPSESEVCHCAYLYGYETEHDIVSQCRIRRNGLQEGIMLFEKKFKGKEGELWRLQGQKDILLKEANNLADKEYIKTVEKEIINFQTDLKAIQAQIDKNYGAMSEDEHWIKRYSYSGKLNINIPYEEKIDNQIKKQYKGK